jgi:hypothetical protein
VQQDGLGHGLPTDDSGNLGQTVISLQTHDRRRCPAVCRCLLDQEVGRGTGCNLTVMSDNQDLSDRKAHV